MSRFSADENLFRISAGEGTIFTLQFLDGGLFLTTITDAHDPLDFEKTKEVMICLNDREISALRSFLEQHKEK